MLAGRKRIAPAPIQSTSSDAVPIIDQGAPLSAASRESAGHQAWMEVTEPLPSLAQTGDSQSLAGLSMKSQETMMSNVAQAEFPGRDAHPQQPATRPVSSTSRGTLFGRRHRGRVMPLPDGQGAAQPIDILPSERESPTDMAAVSSGSGDEVMEENGDTMNELEEIGGDAQQYVPFHLAQRWIVKMGGKMQAMKSKHINIAREMDVAYRRIESDTEDYFEAFVRQLREQHRKKVSNVREVLRLTKDGQREKEKEWKKTVEDLVAKNKSLAQTKQSLLTQVKRLFEQLQAEKEALQQQMKEQLNAERQARAADIESLRTQHNNEVAASAELMQRAIQEKDDDWEGRVGKRQAEWLAEAQRQCQGLCQKSADCLTQVSTSLHERLDGVQQRIVAVTGTIHTVKSSPLTVEAHTVRAVLSSQLSAPITEQLHLQQSAPTMDTSSAEVQNTAVHCLFQVLQVVKDLSLSDLLLEEKQASCQAELESFRSDQPVDDAADTADRKSRLLEVEARTAALELLQNRDSISGVQGLAEHLGVMVFEFMPKHAPAPETKEDSGSSSSDEDDEKEHGEDDGGGEGIPEQHTKRVSQADLLVHAAGVESEDIQRLQSELSGKDEKLERLRRDYNTLNMELFELKDACSKLQSESQKKEAGVRAELEEELNQKTTSLRDVQAQLKTLEEERLQAIPVDAAEEVMRYRDKLALLESEIEEQRRLVVESQVKCRLSAAKAGQLESQIEQAEKSASELKVFHAQSSQEKEMEMVDLRTRQKAALDLQTTSSMKTVKALEAKMEELQRSRKALPAQAAKQGKKDKDVGRIEDVKKQLKASNAKVQELTAKCKQLEKEVVSASRGGGAGGGGSVEDKRELKKKEKELKELTKQLEQAKRQLEARTTSLKAAEEEVMRLSKELQRVSDESSKLKAEIAKLGVEAKIAMENGEKVKTLQEKVKQQGEELATALENYSNERVLRKKYYNTIEDMKGKIRVYCRARPLSKSERDRGNHSVMGSPDEYTITIQTQRGPKEFNFDQVFTPDHSQEKVFEDTRNLIQSAMDGFNVCIFAYGQTGSGKTYTMIGANTSLESPVRGIAPRAFNSIFELIESSKKTMACEVSVYMLELYNERLLDLLAIGKDPAKLDIKKNKKGMVVVTGATTNDAASSSELLSIFEKGSKNRHVACTKMNAESSRSHLIVGIVITSTNLASGTVISGKLSLVDLAGSERASKTGATPEQLKEAQSINKSLSALGDVISALSTSQGHIPYRNNKLTMLMQDSLGGNAKTLMFVNISPADYNCDETVVSLTYASRVKLITNDASKNADNKEIARLKTVIAKMKKGEVDGDDED